MHICFFRTQRTRKLLVIPKRWLAVPAALVCIFALCLLVNLPASVTTAAAERQLPIYCVEKDTKVCSLSFDAAWGNAILRRRRINGVRSGVWNKPERSLRLHSSPEGGSVTGWGFHHDVFPVTVFSRAEIHAFAGFAMGRETGAVKDMGIIRCARGDRCDPLLRVGWRRKTALREHNCPVISAFPFRKGNRSDNACRDAGVWDHKFNVRSGKDGFRLRFKSRQIMASLAAAGTVPVLIA